MHRKFKTLRQETLFLAVNIIDRFLSKRQVAKDKLQLVGATCLLIASKMEDMWPPLVRDLVYVASNAFTKQDLKKCARCPRVLTLLFLGCPMHAVYVPMLVVLWRSLAHYDVLFMMTLV